MIRLTERYYDSHAKQYRGRTLLLRPYCIVGLSLTNGKHCLSEEHTVVHTSYGEKYVVLESAETIEQMIEKVEACTK
jgi:uncharacterized protein YlzI (FlbEa/FlbD family)